MKWLREVMSYAIMIALAVWAVYVMGVSSEKRQEAKEKATRSAGYKAAKEEFEGHRTALRDDSAYFLLFFAQPQADAAIVMPFSGKDSRKGEELFVDLPAYCHPDVDSKRVLVTRDSHDGVSGQMVCEWYESTTAAMFAPLVWP